MQVQTNRCPNCSRAFYFPLDYPWGQYRVICPHCLVGYDLRQVNLNERDLDALIFSRRLASVLHKPGFSRQMFQYLASIAREFAFAAPTNPNAIVFLVANTRPPFPQAVYFYNSFHLIQPINRLLFTVSLSLLGALLLLAIGKALIPVLMGATIAPMCFLRLTALPKIKGVTRKRLEAEQVLFKKSHDWQQKLEELHQAKDRYQKLVERQKAVLDDMLLTPERYPAQIDLYRRGIKGAEDYLSLCERAISQYEAAIRATRIQLETSKLADELPTEFVDSQIEFGLDLLQDQLAKHLPPQPSDYEADKHSAG